LLCAAIVYGIRRESKGFRWSFPVTLPPPSPSLGVDQLISRVSPSVCFIAQCFQWNLTTSIFITMDLAQASTLRLLFSPRARIARLIPQKLQRTLHDNLLTAATNMLHEVVPEDLVHRFAQQDAYSICVPHCIAICLLLQDPQARVIPPDPSISPRKPL
jgi:hypothetical protein